MGKLENKTSELHGVMFFFDNCKALKFLTDEEAGKLFKNIANYVCGEELIELDGPLMMIFCMFKEQIDRNRKSYEELCKKNREKAQRRWTKTRSDTSSLQPEDATASNGMPQHADECLTNSNQSDNSNENNNDVANAPIIICRTDGVLEDLYSFEKLWDMYGKKEGNEVELRRAWNAMPAEDRQRAMEYVPKYVASTPDVKYRKYLSNFIKQRIWESNPIMNNADGNYSTYNQNNGGARIADAAGRVALMQQFLAEGEPAE